MGIFGKRKPKEYESLSVEEATFRAHPWLRPSAANQAECGGSAVCTPDRSCQLTGYQPQDDSARYALAVPEPQARPERPIDTTIRSEPSHAYPRRWHGEEVAIEVTQEFERIRR